MKISANLFIGNDERKSKTENQLMKKISKPLRKLVQRKLEDLSSSPNKYDEEKLIDYKYVLIKKLLGL